MKWEPGKLDELVSQGFDLSTIEPGDRIFVKCSLCDAPFIHGKPTHELKCPNQQYAELLSRVMKTKPYK